MPWFHMYYFSVSYNPVNLSLQQGNFVVIFYLQCCRVHTSLPVILDDLCNFTPQSHHPIILIFLLYSKSYIYAYNQHSISMMYPGGLTVKASDAYLHLLQIFTRVTYICFKLPKIPWWPPVQYPTMCNREDLCKSSSNLG